MTGIKHIVFFIGILLFATLIGMLTALGAGLPLIAVLILLCGMVATMFDFRVGVMLVVLMMPLAATVLMPRQMLGVPGFTPLNAVLVCTLAAAIGAYLIGRRPLPPVAWRLYAPMLLLLALGSYIGSSKVSLIAAHYFIASPTMYTTAKAYYLAELIKPMLILAAVWLLSAAVAQSKQPQRWVALVGVSIVLLPVLVFLAAALSGLSLSEMATPAARTFLNATGLHANELAVVLLPAYTAALFMMPAYRSPAGKLWGLAVMGATVGALLLTFSRAAFLGAILTTFTFFFLRRSYRYIFMGVLVFAVVAVTLPESFVERATQGMGQRGTIGAHNDPLTAGRVGGIWLPLLPEIQRHIVLGDGINSTLWSAPARQGLVREGHPHNAYLRLLKDHGIVGIPLIGYFLLQVWRLYRRLARDETQPPLVRGYFNGMSVALLVFFVQCLSGSRLIFEQLHVFYWLAIGIGLGLEHIQRRQAVQPAAAQPYVPAPAAGYATAAA
ncbi:hypothetical protein GTP58_29775 [Duganella sp. CY15W]|uniref:O-antigen ligase family protein n=1 Tax=Duganella sp. CY15W TaxID=2692172 RepID=UPI0013705553|nr:O-antigen ligase family protein [Duganella sp. CY15W]MYM32530.1 hypothetical protein [Duganella sp. CY15W]